MADSFDKFVRDFADMLTKESLSKKHLLKYSWISGSSTVVYPVTIFRDSRSGMCEITLQWDCPRRIFGRFIDRMVSRGKPYADYGIFSANDGSCPASITFYLSDKEG